MAEPVSAPHAEKEFGRLVREVGKVLPARLTQVVRIGSHLRALPATTNKKVKG